MIYWTKINKKNKCNMPALERKAITVEDHLPGMSRT
jgi:hypothetical protein